MEGYDDGSLYAPFLSLKPHQSLSKSELEYAPFLSLKPHQSLSKSELEQGREEASKVREGSSRSKELKKKKVKKQKFAFQTRSQVDILDDGYRWRKYGQKAVKNNKFPRSYYRCTYGGCNVKKQVQRLTPDQEVVVTTYEGVHSHPIEKNTENFEHILTQMQIYSSF